MQPQDQSLTPIPAGTEQNNEAHTLVQELQSVLNRFLATGTTQAAQAINEVAVTAEQTVQQLRQDHQTALADTVEGLAQQIRRFTTNMQQQDLQTTLHDIEEGAKKHRDVLIGGGIILGLLAARIASSRKS